MSSGRKYERACSVCSTEFTATRRDAKYCSHACAVRANRSISDDGPPAGRRCEFCGKSIDHKRRDARFCDIRCSRNAWYYTTGRSLRPREGRTCDGCGNDIDLLRHPNATYCSTQCREVVRRVRAHGITVTEYRQLLERQAHRCAICQCGELTLREGLVRDGWHIDHDHATGKVRGVLCPLCNLLIGYAKDSPGVLRAAADYLERTS